MISLIYGLPPIIDSSDPLIIWVDRLSERLSESSRPGAYLVEFFSWMERLPRWMCTWRKEAEAWHDETSIKLFELFEGVSKRMDEGTQAPCIAASLVEEVAKHNLGKEQAAWTAISLYLGGTETTSGQMLWFLIAMVLYPGVQKRAHEELDHVVGRSRMPTLQDYEHLPYIRAIVKEVMRWRPAFPMALPHRLEEDDHYDGFFLPKGSFCFVNTWGLNHDPDIYGSDADTFNPGRFLDSTWSDNDSFPAGAKEEGHVAFGFGRRVCVGRHVANNAMFIQVASILWALRVLPGSDDLANSTLPDPNATTDRGIGLHAAPFGCNLVSRFEDVASIVAGSKDVRVST
ncbi:hypothetical protein ONZ45_g349 [Pleurotus djamor]|nr:hypothetical protein ONZ45_g349 [Pleurotus djamor]